MTQQAFNKEEVKKAMISKLQEEDAPKELRVKNMQGYNMPDKIKLNESNEIIPDIEALYNNETSIYEIELDKSLPIEKWKSLARFAHDKNGNLYLVIPDYLIQPIKDEIESNEINAGVIYFNTQ